ncbi:hypothetical protein STEG23_003027, partial [Scotinomys teguina]
MFCGLLQGIGNSLERHQLMDSENVVHLHMECYLAVMKNEMMKFGGKGIEPEFIILNENCLRSRCSAELRTLFQSVQVQAMPDGIGKKPVYPSVQVQAMPDGI